MTLLTPPEETGTALVLTPAEPPAKVEPETVSSFIPQVEVQRQAVLKSQAHGYASDLVKMNPNSPAFAERINEINSLAQKDIVRSGQGTSRMLERSLAGAKKNGGDVSQRVASTLNELRSTVEDLVPNAADLSPAKKILGFIPGGKKISRYFQKYESAQTQLNSITKSLLAGQDELLKDNASLNQSKQELWETMISLNEFIFFAASLDSEISQEITNLRNAGEVEKAATFESDFLFPVRQRRQDLLTQLAVAVQGYMSMELVRKNNVELIKGVDRSRTTTIFALQTAMVVSQALDTQALVLDQIDAVNAVTNKTIENTALMLRQQTARVHQQAVNSGVSVETLARAFDNIFATIDEVEAFKAQANQNMEVTINGLQEQLQRAKPQLERAIEMEKREGAQRSLSQ
jgi:uncharacterized protein YaaN involved in tellurite resistance